MQLIALKKNQNCSMTRNERNSRKEIFAPFNYVQKLKHCLNKIKITQGSKLSYYTCAVYNLHLNRNYKCNVFKHTPA